MLTAHDTDCYCHGCRDTIARDTATWLDGEPYCDECAPDDSDDYRCDVCGSENLKQSTMRDPDTYEPMLCCGDCGTMRCPE